MVLAKVLGTKNGGPGVQLTLGNCLNEVDWPFQGTINLAESFGNKLIKDQEVVVDKDNKIITTYAYMKATSTPYEVFLGIDKMIDEFSKYI